MGGLLSTPPFHLPGQAQKKLRVDAFERARPQSLTGGSTKKDQHIWGKSGASAKTKAKQHPPESSLSRLLRHTQRHEHVDDLSPARHRLPANVHLCRNACARRRVSPRLCSSRWFMSRPCFVQNGQGKQTNERRGEFKVASRRNDRQSPTQRSHKRTISPAQRRRPFLFARGVGLRGGGRPRLLSFPRPLLPSLTHATGSNGANFEHVLSTTASRAKLTGDPESSKATQESWAVAEGPIRT